MHGVHATDMHDPDPILLVIRYEKLGAVNLSAAAKGRGRTKMYRVVQTARLRTGFELDSELIGSLEPGDVLRVLEERQNENGVVRVRCSRGWTSADGRDGAPCVNKAIVCMSHL